jgi:transposase
VRAEGNGRLLTFALTPGQQYDITMAETLLEQGSVLRKSTGRKRRYPKRLVADKGYSRRKFRSYLRKHGIAVTVLHKENDRHEGAFDKVVYRTRNRVERLFARLKQFCRIPTRYEKRGEFRRDGHDCWYIPLVIVGIQTLDKVKKSNYQKTRQAGLPYANRE